MSLKTFDAPPPQTKTCVLTIQSSCSLPDNLECLAIPSVSLGTQGIGFGKREV
jgi:hypothetical protein